MDWGEAAPIFPKEDWDGALFESMRSEKLLALQSETSTDLNCGCGLGAWGLEYDEFLTFLRKHRFPKGHHCAGCVLGPGVVEDNVHLLVQLAYPRRARSFLNRFFRTKQQFPRACRHGVFKL